MTDPDAKAVAAECQLGSVAGQYRDGKQDGSHTIKTALRAGVAGLVARINTRVHDAPLPIEYLLDDAAALIAAQAKMLEEAKKALEHIAKCNREPAYTRGEHYRRVAESALAKLEAQSHVG